MNKDTLNATNKKAGNGNGNSVINNYERKNTKPSNYVSGEYSSSSSHKYSNTTK